MEHDARITLTMPFGGNPYAKPYSWDCLGCKAEGKRYATGKQAIKAAAKHNGNGKYNYQDKGWQPVEGS